MKLNILIQDITPDNPPPEIKRVWEVGVYDPARHVHCCSLTPSYEIWLATVSSWARPHEEADESRIQDIQTDYEQECEKGCERVRYYNVTDLDRLPVLEEVSFSDNPTAFVVESDGWPDLKPDDDPEEYYTDLMEAAGEYLRGNWII